MAERVLAIVAHPDDETFGCGGTLAKHAKAGDEVKVIAFTDGVGSRGRKDGEPFRLNAFRSACKALGIECGERYFYFDNEMDDVPLLRVVRDIETHLRGFKPTVVYTHWHGDLNVDHRVVHEATKVACRPQPGCTVKQLYYFEVPCSTRWGAGFDPSYFVDVLDTVGAKDKAIACYADELRQWPHPRSSYGMSMLASFRGTSVGLMAAESFMVGRIVG